MQVTRSDLYRGLIGATLSELEEIVKLVNNAAPLMPQEFVQRLNALPKLIRIQLEIIENSPI